LQTSVLDAVPQFLKLLHDESYLVKSAANSTLTNFMKHGKKFLDLFFISSNIIDLFPDYLSVALSEAD